MLKKNILIVEDYLPNTIELGSYSNPYGLNYTGSSNGYVTNLDWNQTTDYFKLQINDELGIWYGSGTTISECGLQYDQFGDPIPNNTPSKGAPSKPPVVRIFGLIVGEKGKRP